SIDAPAITVTISYPGQQARVTFAGIAEQKVLIDISNVTTDGGGVSVLHPDGSRILDYGLFNSGGLPDGIVWPLTLPVTGTYTVVIDPFETATGNLDLAITTVPSAVSGTLTLNGASTVTTI